MHDSPMPCPRDVPYRVDIPHGGREAFEHLVDLGALDVEILHDGTVAAVLPDHTHAEQIARIVGRAFSISTAVPRDAGSVWLLSPRPIRAGGLQIVPAHMGAEAGALRLTDSGAFGTGLHPTTALCLEALAGIVANDRPDAVLDVGTGSGVLALAALMLGVPRALGIDIEDEALRVAGDNARLNGLDDRFQAMKGAVSTITTSWPLILANVLAAPLIEMAPALVRCVGHAGQIVLSGIPTSVEADVDQAYRRMGMQHVRSLSRGGWIALVLRASW
jgi:ribosomal protein L11 methyltransferase